MFFCWLVCIFLNSECVREAMVDCRICKFGNVLITAMLGYLKNLVTYGGNVSYVKRVQFFFTALV